MPDEDESPIPGVTVADARSHKGPLRVGLGSKAGRESAVDLTRTAE